MRSRLPTIIAAACSVAGAVIISASLLLAIWLVRSSGAEPHPAATVLGSVCFALAVGAVVLNVALVAGPRSGHRKGDRLLSVRSPKGPIETNGPRTPAQ